MAECSSTNVPLVLLFLVVSWLVVFVLYRLAQSTEGSSLTAG